MKYLLLVVLGLSLVFSQPSQLYYKSGDEHDYQFQSNLDTRGHNVATGDRSGGGYSSMTGTMVVQCVGVYPTYYNFVMNMINVNVDGGAGPVNVMEYAKRSTGGKSDTLGADVYFRQHMDGKITDIWFSTDDDPYFVSIKSGGINVLQTRVINPGEVESFDVSDPVGNHTATYQAATDNTNLLMSHSFNQNDVQTFADPTLHSGNVQFNAGGNHNIAPHPADDGGGYIAAGAGENFADMVAPDMQPDGRKRQDGNALDYLLSNKGSINFNAGASRFADIHIEPRRLTPQNIEHLESSGKYKRTNLFEIGQKHARNPFPREDMNDLETEFAALIPVRPVGKDEIEAHTLKMMKLITRMNRTAGSAQMIEKYAKDVESFTEDEVRNTFYMLAGIEDDYSTQLLIDYGLGSENVAIRMNAIMASNGFQKGLKPLVEKLFEITLTNNVDHATSAVLAIGSALGRSDDTQLHAFYGTILLEALHDSIEKKDEVKIIPLVHAIGNAGPVIPRTAVPWDALLQFNKSVINAAQTATRKFNFELAPFASLKRNADFPYNKNWTDGITLGGSSIGLTATGELFAGTNEDCVHKEYFNYEALAKASVNLKFFSWSKEAFVLNAVYGKANGQVIGNTIYMKVWDNVIFNQKLDMIDCTPHVYPIYHIQKGLSIGYTLWVTVIPVTFSLSASGTLDIKWSWEVCDSTGMIDVKLIPTVTLTLSAQAEVYLLIVKAGIHLSGSFEAAVVPQAYIDATGCDVGFRADYISTPGSFKLGSYYMWHKCKLWIFDCKWGDSNDQDWLSWSSQQQDKVLFNTNWTIIG